MSEAEFSRDWTLCQIAPGINLIAMCILVGRKIAGARGSVLCLFGLLLPSVSITVLLTALYAPVRDSEIVKAALRGVIPASVGLGLLTAYNVATPPLKDSAKEGKLSGGFGVTLIGLSAAAMVYGKLPVVSILAGLGGISALFQVWRQRQASPKTTETP
jgi:chromate transporter